MTGPISSPPLRKRYAGFSWQRYRQQNAPKDVVFQGGLDQSRIGNGDHDVENEQYTGAQTSGKTERQQHRKDEFRAHSR